MKPISFPGCNVVFGAGQEEYQPLPAMRFPDGHIITCWELTDEEIARISMNRRIYFQQMTFNQMLQPSLPIVDLGDDLGLSLPDSLIS